MTSFKSWKSYWNFESEIRNRSRYVWSQFTSEFLDTIAITAERRRIKLGNGTKFWRAQLGHAWMKLDPEDFEVECAYPRSRMKPLRDQASEGRVNPTGIPCLYVAGSVETAVSEVRPWIGSYVSVGEFILNRDLEAVDCSQPAKNELLYLEEPPPAEIERMVWAHIDRAYAEPVTRSDNYASYAPTQIISEKLRQCGFEAIIYRSNFGVDGKNIALFDIDVADMTTCALRRIESVEIKFSPSQDPYFVTTNDR